LDKILGRFYKRCSRTDVCEIIRRVALPASIDEQVTTNLEEGWPKTNARSHFLKCRHLEGPGNIALPHAINSEDDYSAESTIPKSGHSAAKNDVGVLSSVANVWGNTVTAVN